MGGNYTIWFDTYRRPNQVQDELGRTTSLQEDGRGRITSYTYPESDQELLQYDDHNNVTLLTKVPKPGSSQSNIQISAQWDQTWNKPLSITDGNQNTYSFTYYMSGTGASLVNTAVLPSPGGTYTYGYNSFGQLTSIQDPTSLVVSNSYDPSIGDLLSTTLDPTGVNATTRFTYNANGDRITMTDANSNVTEYQYDNDRRKTVTLHHNGGLSANLLAAELTQYDPVGRDLESDGGTAFSGATTVTNWQMLSRRTYTPTGQIQTEQNGAQNTTQYRYDGLDRPTIVTDPSGRNVGTSYDAVGEVLCIWRGWTSRPPGT